MKTTLHKTNHTRIIRRSFSFLCTLRWFLVSSSPSKNRWHHTLLQHSSFRILGLYKILIPKMLRTNFGVFVNCELLVIGSSYTKNPQLPFFWVNRKSMKCKCSIPRIAAIGAAAWNTAMMTHAEKQKKQIRIMCSSPMSK